MEDFISADMKAWRQNFRVNSKIKSLNNNVKTLYEIILKNEMTDSDYWYFGGGANEFIDYLSRFNSNDFQELIADIPNWTEDQKCILSDCLAYGGMRYENHRSSKVFKYQSFLLTFLFSVTNDADTKIAIFENAEIINDGEPKPYHLLLLIKTWADNQKNQLPSEYEPSQIHYDIIENAIHKASR